jgi:hypothetical protein
LTDLRARFSKARDKYHRSGNHEAEFPVDEFARFCAGDDSALYAFVVWGDEVQTFFHRRVEGLEEDCGERLFEMGESDGRFTH